MLLETFGHRINQVFFSPPSLIDEKQFEGQAHEAVPSIGINQDSLSTVKRFSRFRY